MSLSLIAFSAIVVSNVCYTLGFGILGVIPHKKHTEFMLCSNLMILLESIVCTALYYLLYTFVLAPLKVTEFALISVVIIALIVDLVAMLILKKVSKENYFHYEKNFMFVVHAIVIIGIALSCNLSLDFVYVLFYVGAQFLGLFVVNVIFYALNSRINNRTLPDHIRALSPQLVVMSVLSLIGYLLAGLLA